VSPGLDVSVEEAQDVVVVHVAGEIDLASAPALKDKLASAVPNRALGLVIDLSGTTYLDSSGVSLVFDFAERLRRRGQELRLVIPDGAPLRRVLRIVDADGTMPVLDTVDEATDQIRATT
jgi:anti-sigma B factor antagonist